MALVVDCPSCTRKLRLPTDLLGRMVKCASCGGTFEAKETPAPTPPPEPRRETPLPKRPSRRARTPRDDFDFEDNGGGQCPRCGEEVRSGASRCRHCGEELEEEQDDRPWERGVRRDCEPHRGGMVLTLGIVSIVCSAVSLPFFCCYGFGALIAGVGLALGIPAWVMGHRDLAMMRQGVKDPAGRGLTQGGWICAIIGTCLNVMMALASLAMLCLIIVGFMASPAPAPGPAPAPVTRPAPQRKMEIDLGRRGLSTIDAFSLPSPAYSGERGRG